jgi:hypothetical protein
MVELEPERLKSHMAFTRILCIPWHRGRVKAVSLRSYLPADDWYPTITAPVSVAPDQPILISVRKVALWISMVLGNWNTVSRWLLFDHIEVASFPLGIEPIPKCWIIGLSE